MMSPQKTFKTGDLVYFMRSVKLSYISWQYVPTPAMVVEDSWYASNYVKVFIQESLKFDMIHTRKLFVLDESVCLQPHMQNITDLDDFVFFDSKSGVWTTCFAHASKFDEWDDSDCWYPELDDYDSDEFYASFEKKVRYRVYL